MRILWICARESKCKCTCIYKRVRVCLCICTNIRIMRAWLFARTHTHIHTHTHRLCRIPVLSFSRSLSVWSRLCMCQSHPLTRNAFAFITRWEEEEEEEVLQKPVISCTDSSHRCMRSELRERVGEGGIDEGPGYVCEGGGRCSESILLLYLYWKRRSWYFKGGFRGRDHFKVPAHLISSRLKVSSKWWTIDSVCGAHGVSFNM